MTGHYYHSLRFDPERCDGCMSCMRVCPAAAIRVRRHCAVRLEDRCVDCGECLKVCSKSAVVPLTDSLADLSRFAHTIAIPSPALFAQVDPTVAPATVLAALRHCGFDDAADVATACSEVNLATELYLARHRGPFPVISSFCPTVVRLVEVQYPDLVGQLLPLLAPREITARDVKARKRAESGLAPEKIGAVYITPCSAKMVSIVDHPGMTRSFLDAAVSFGDLFHLLAAAVARVRQAAETASVALPGSGVAWAVRGGFSRGLPAENSLAVAGLGNVIRILDDIEKGRLQRYAFVECHACPEGCVSGPLTVENPYVARAKAIHLLQTEPPAPVLERAAVEARFAAGDFLLDSRFVAQPLRPLDEDISHAIAKMKEKERILDELPGIDCGACGAPTCQAFAEDVVLGQARKSDCLFVWRREVSGSFATLASLFAPEGPAREERRAKSSDEH